MTNRPQGRLVYLPLETQVEICKWLDPLTRWHLSSSCRAFAAAGRLALFSSVHAQVAYDQAASFSRWLQEHGSRITNLYIQGQALHSQHAKSALWAALSAPNHLEQLQHLQLNMPLSPEDEAAVLTGVCANAPGLTSLHLHYQRPLSHARKSNVVCFCAHSSAAPWATAAGQLRGLRITGACFCNMGYVAQLRGLTLLQVSCCNTTNPGAELAQLLQQLPHLQQLTYATSAPAVIDYAIAAALAAHSSLTHLELHNFAAPASSNSNSSGSIGAITAAAGLGVAAGAAASPTVVNALLGVALQRLQSLKLLDFSGTLRLLPMLAAASASGSSETGAQLQQLQLARSRQDGFMPALLAGLFSDSDSDSDSDDSDGDSNDADSSSSSSRDDSSIDKNCSDYAEEEAGTGCCGGSGWSGGCCGGGGSKVAAAGAAAAAAVLRSSSLQRLSCGSTGSAAARLHNSIAPLALLHSLVDLDLSGFGLSDIGPVFSLTLLTSLQLGPGLGAVGSSQHVNRVDSSGLAGIRALQQLQYLDVSHNQVRWDSLLLLQGLTGLTYLSLAGNDLSSGSSSSCSIQGSLACSSELISRGCSSKAVVMVDAQVMCCSGGSSSGCCASDEGCPDASSSEDEVPTPKSSSSTQAGAVFVSGKAAAAAAAATDCKRRLRSNSSSSTSRTCGSQFGAAALPSNGCMLGVSPDLFKNNISSSSMWLLPSAKLRHLDVSGCGLSSVPDLTVTSGLAVNLPVSLTCLKAGTSLRHMGNGAWAKKANQLTPACVASLAGLTNLQDLEIAANVPPGCYAGFRGLKQVTRLVVQDFAAAEGLFLFDQGPSSSSSSKGYSSSKMCSGSSSSNMEGSASPGCCFPHLMELGVMLRGPAGAAAMRQLASSCRALRKLSIYQDLTAAAPSAAAGRSSGMCCASAAAACGSASTSAAAGGSSSSSWHFEALAGLTWLQQLSLQPPGDLWVLTGLTSLRHVQLLGPEDGWRPDRTMRGQPGTAAPAAAAAGTGMAVAGGVGSSAQALKEAAVCDAPDGSDGGCCGGGSAAAAAAGGGGAACVGPCCERQPVCAAPAVAVTGPGVRCVTDGELLGLGVLKKLTHLELQHVVLNDSAVDELQKLLPCTRISV